MSMGGPKQQPNGSKNKKLIQAQVLLQQWFYQAKTKILRKVFAL